MDQKDNKTTEQTVNIVGNSSHESLDQIQPFESLPHHYQYMNTSRHSLQFGSPIFSPNSNQRRKQQLRFTTPRDKHDNAFPKVTVTSPKANAGLLSYVFVYFFLFFVRILTVFDVFVFCVFV